MQLHCCALILTVVLGCIGTIEAGTRCRNPPILKRPDECCEFPQFDKEVAVIEKCVATHGAQAARLMADKTPGPVRGSCLAECIFNGTGHANLNADKMTEDSLKQAEAKGLAAEWTPVIKSMADICRVEMENRKAEFEEGAKLPPLDASDQVCHPKYGFVLMCTMRHMLSNCPAKFFKDTAECKQLQEFTSTCEL